MSCDLPRNNHAFTILELLIVIGIVAMMMSLAVGTIGVSTSAQLKKESAALAAAVRYSYHQAAIKNLPYRIVFDMTDQAYWLEEGSGPFYLGKEEEEKKKEETKKQEAKKGEEEGEGSESEGGEAPSADEASFAAEDSVIKKVVFKDEIKIRDVYVAHQEEPVSGGQAFLYFFPHGLTEKSVIHLSDEEGENNMTIVVNPVTGKARIENGYLEHDKLGKE